MEGNHKLFPHFEAAPHDLRLSFDTLIEEKIKNFVGREVLFKEIDKFLEDEGNDSGYLIIRGEPGIGKTAFIAKLVKDRGFIHHFNIISQNIRTISHFISNISSQLISLYNLDSLYVPLDYLYDGAFLSTCLEEAAKKRGNEKIVIVIDALDESDQSTLAPGVNALYLPHSLPKGVYFIITTRFLKDFHLNVSKIRILDLKSDSPYNMEDVKRYIECYNQRQQMKERLKIMNVEKKDFIETLCKKSQGNFMYLYYVLPAIENGNFSEGTLDELPEGLKGYYNRHWLQMKNISSSQSFENVYESIVFALSIVQEPVSIEWISDLMDIEESDVRDAINYWREFLFEHKNNGILVYRIYHTSFQEFLKEKTDLKKYHRNIAEKGLKNLLNRGIIKNSLEMK